MSKRSDFIIAILLNVFVFIIISFFGSLFVALSEGTDMTELGNTNQIIDTALFGNTSYTGVYDYLGEVQQAQNESLDINDITSDETDDSPFDILEGVLNQNPITRVLSLLVFAQVPVVTLHRFYVEPWNSAIGAFFGSLILWVYQIWVFIQFIKVWFRDRVAQD